MLKSWYLCDTSAPARKRGRPRTQDGNTVPPRSHCPRRNTRRPCPISSPATADTLRSRGAVYSRFSGVLPCERERDVRYPRIGTDEVECEHDTSHDRHRVIGIHHPSTPAIRAHQYTSGSREEGGKDGTSSRRLPARRGYTSAIDPRPIAPCVQMWARRG